MNIQQVQKLNSAQVVTGVMKSSAHQPLWLGVPGIVEAVGTVESVTARISNRPPAIRISTVNLGSRISRHDGN